MPQAIMRQRLHTRAARHEFADRLPLGRRMKELQHVLPLTLQLMRQRLCAHCGKQLPQF
jgi:hypothetical protein